ncbi:RNA polymerase sigma factor [Alicyclobacillus acidoterrestris]|uniref:RNA polymerase sigma factor n=1 Tax=Alicyclobacillus acidoterrestris TaxID=1450 RepID=UPI003F53E3CE
MVNIDQVQLLATGDDIAQADTRVMIDEAMKQLSYAERVAFVLVDYIGCTENEAAQIAGWGLGKLKYRLRRARSIIAKHFTGDAIKGKMQAKGGIQHV